MTFTATKQAVSNRGVPPDEFLENLVLFGKIAPDDIFEANPYSDIYGSVKKQLGPWPGLVDSMEFLDYRRCVMLEVLRVLAGFESSWKPSTGRDTTNPASFEPETTEAGLWQVSADSMNFGQELRDLVRFHAGTLDPIEFQVAMKSDFALAVEYCARLLRRTCSHNGPLKRGEIHNWLKREAVSEFMELLSGSG